MNANSLMLRGFLQMHRDILIEMTRNERADFLRDNAGLPLLLQQAIRERMNKEKFTKWLDATISGDERKIMELNL